MYNFVLFPGHGLTRCIDEEAFHRIPAIRGLSNNYCIHYEALRFPERKEKIRDITAPATSYSSVSRASYVT